jgi:nucleotide-binding universal stress UspA family protein
MAMIEISRILCPMDFSDFSQQAYAYAVAMARWYRARITTLHVVVNRPAVEMIPSLYMATVPPMSLTSLREELATRLEGIARPYAPEVQTDVMVQEAPDIHREILTQADLLKADLIVMGTHGRGGFDRVVLGSVTEKVMRKATSPVLVVPPHAHDAPVSDPVRFHRILCPVDFSAGSLDALPYALSLAEEADAHLTLLHVVEALAELYQPAMASPSSLEGIRAAAEASRLERLQSLVPDQVRTYCTVETALAEGRASKEILRVATERDSDLIVMGVQGRSALDRMFFGSNTHDVIRTARCPVLTVRSPSQLA